MKTSGSASDPLWFKDAIIYELHVRAFFDSNNDGNGDFQGLTQRLDYLQDLGVTCIWLLPFFPSPLKDDGYDISDYLNVHPDYGTLDDFKAFLRCGARTQHAGDDRIGHQPHFRSAPLVSARAPCTAWFRRNAISTSGATPTRNTQTLALFLPIPKNRTGPGIPVANAYYWHRFFSHQPDLNFDNPLVIEEVQKVDALLARHGGGRPAAGCHSLSGGARQAPIARIFRKRTRL